MLKGKAWRKAREFFAAGGGVSSSERLSWEDRILPPEGVALVNASVSGEVLSDAQARREISTDLRRSLFVEAGAGTGKTTALVSRIVELVRNGVSPSNFAAITFTRKAAAELRERVRVELTKQERSSGEGAHRFSSALQELDAAAIGTLHSFARRILAEHAMSAGLPPRLEVANEISYDMTFSVAWDRFFEELLDDPYTGKVLVNAFTLDLKESSLRALARSMANNWDLLGERIRPVPPQAGGNFPRGVDFGASERNLATGLASDDPEVMSLLADMRYLAVQSQYCDVPSDHLAEALADLDAEADFLAEAEGIEVLGHLMKLAKVPTHRGNAENWVSYGKDAKDQLAQELKTVKERAAEIVGKVGKACAVHLMGRLADFTLRQVEERCRGGRLASHDLLVLARDLLRKPDVRDSLHRQYEVLLIDEFQDTDPIQAEIALLIAAGGGVETSEVVSGNWDVSSSEGRLLFVGDPKQSIYRFRRADINMYFQVAGLLNDDRRLTLSGNWRSAVEILDWVNHVFTQLISLSEGSQPPYVPLEAGRSTPEPPLGVSRVNLLGRKPMGKEVPAGELREAEFALVAEFVKKVSAEGWPIVCRGEDDSERLRPARYEDICVLIPKRLVLPQLTWAFEQAGIPFRLESSARVYSTPEVSALMAVLRAVNDPSDHFAVVTALRSLAFGFGDDDLYEYRCLCRGSYQAWSYLSEQPEHPVSDALAWMEKLHSQIMWLSPGEILDRVIRDRHMLELAFFGSRYRDALRRVRFAADQARAYSDATGGSLRSYLGWVGAQMREGSRTPEAIVPDTDDDAVRVMTAHAAKGLEFPIAVIAGFSGTQTPARGLRTPWLLFGRDRGWEDGDGLGFEGDLEDVSGEGGGMEQGGSVDYKLSGYLASDTSREAIEREKELAFHQFLRLLYVACTRARDYLAVSLFRTDRAPADWAKLSCEQRRQKMTGAELFAEASDGFPVACFEADSEAPPAPAPEASESVAASGAELAADSGIGERAHGEEVVDVKPGALPAEQAGKDDGAVRSNADWREQREMLWARASRPATVAAGGVRSLMDAARATASGGTEALGNSSGEVAISSDAAADLGDMATDDEEHQGSSDTPERYDEAEFEESQFLRRGRFGTSFGSVVHNTLSAIPFAAPPAGSPAETRSASRLSGEESSSGTREPEGDVDAVDAATLAASAESQAADDLGVDADELRAGETLQGEISRHKDDLGVDADELRAAVERFASEETLLSSRIPDAIGRVCDALASPSVVDARRSRHWREIYMGAEVEGTFLEGLMDLLYQTPDGSYVVVDYKTDEATNPADLDKKLAYYTPQLAAYALLVAEATGSPVSSALIVFLTPEGAVERKVTDLPAAVEEVRQTLRAAAGG